VYKLSQEDAVDLFIQLSKQIRHTDINVYCNAILQVVCNAMDVNRQAVLGKGRTRILCVPGS